jgi:UDP-2-acetamido-3-amino-2,3-dideoxy-glucuronate N-acetyltransferase
MTRRDGVFVHPQGLCESTEVGDGTRVWAFAHVLPGAVIGRDCNICDHAFIESGARLGDRVTVKNAVLVWDGVTIEDEVFLGPNVLFTNGLRPRAAVKQQRDELLPTYVRRGATLGAGVVVVCGTTVGSYAFAAAGAVLVRDVPAYALMAGNPARQRGWVCACGERLSSDLGCTSCSRTYRSDSSELGLEPLLIPRASSQPKLRLRGGGPA